MGSAAAQTSSTALRTLVSLSLLEHSFQLLECSTESNSTSSLFGCIVKRHRDGDSHLQHDTQAPSAQADDEAVKHLSELENHVVHQKTVNLNQASTRTFREETLDWLQTGGTSMPMIFALGDGDWGRSCDDTVHNLGYRYTLEHWLRGVILEGMAMRTRDVEAADYVYLPHCACGIFMHLTARDLKQQEEEWASVLRKSGDKWKNSTKPHFDYLLYEGRLPPRAVDHTDNIYLMGQTKIWATDPAYQNCLRRADCRFLIVSIYGRHVFKKFSDHFGDKAIFITHAGMSPWLSQQSQEFFLPDLLRLPQLKSLAWPAGCRAACLAQCQLEPPATLTNDIVMPWTVAYRWTARSANFNERDILAFYSGTQNSCSREYLVNVFEKSFAEHVEEASAGPDSGALRLELTHMKKSSLRKRAVAYGALESDLDAADDAEDSKEAFIQLNLALERTSVWKRQRQGRLRKGASLVFPPDFRLKQEDWSELAFRSQVCISPDGDSPNTGRLVEVIMHGCVPLIISERLQPPVHEFLDWSQFAFFLHEDSLPDLPRILREDLFSPAGRRSIAVKHANLAQVAHMFDYNRDGISTLLLLILRHRARQWT